MQVELPHSFFDLLISELKRLCREGASGTLFVTTEHSHSARFALEDGLIVSINYRTKNGLDAIPFIRGIKTGSFSFSDANVFRSRTTAASLPTTAELIRLLSLAPEDCSRRPVPVQSTSVRPATHPAAAPISQQNALAANSSSTTLPVAIPAKTILVVEDSATTRKVIAKILMDGGYAVLEAENGMAAFAQLSENKPDMMLLDIVMPGIDGYKILSMIRKHDAFKHLPVIMLTSRDGLLDKLRGRMGGSDEYLTKPFTAEQLLEKVSKYLLPGH